jgi:hypothetical protein
MAIAHTDLLHIEQQLSKHEGKIAFGRTKKGPPSDTSPNAALSYARVPVHEVTLTAEHLVSLADIAQNCSEANIECSLHVGSGPNGVALSFK